MDLNLWKNKDELKKFLENLGIEYRYGCFEENNPETCHLLGDYLLSIDKARTKAAQVYKNNCNENKYGLSCDAFGRMALKGQGMDAPNSKLALEYFLKGCDQDEARSCYHGGLMLGAIDKHINKIITPNPEKSLELLKKSCLSKKLPIACSQVHTFYRTGFHGHPANLKLAAEWAEIACDQNEILGCHNLSRMYHLGQGVKADMDKSKYYHERAKEIEQGRVKDLQTKKDATSDLG